MAVSKKPSSKKMTKSKSESKTKVSSKPKSSLKKKMLSKNRKVALGALLALTGAGAAGAAAYRKKYGKEEDGPTAFGRFLGFKGRK